MPLEYTAKIGGEIMKKRNEKRNKKVREIMFDESYVEQEQEQEVKIETETAIPELSIAAPEKPIYGSSRTNTIGVSITPKIELIERNTALLQIATAFLSKNIEIAAETQARILSLAETGFVPILSVFPASFIKRHLLSVSVRKGLSLSDAQIQAFSRNMAVGIREYGTAFQPDRFGGLRRLPVFCLGCVGSDALNFKAEAFSTAEINIALQHFTGEFQSMLEKVIAK